MSLDINKLDVFIGKQIRFFRKKMTSGGLKTLASKLGISIQQLQKYETAKNKVSASLLYDMAKALGITIEHFFAHFDEHAIDDSQHKSSFNILLIEDNLDEEVIIRDVLHEFPQKMDLYPIHDGFRALDFLREMREEGFKSQAKPDLILIELHLPKCNGLDILKTLKKDKCYTSTPMVLLTDGSNSSEMLMSYNMNASGFIVKSSSTEDFKHQMYNLFNYWTQLVKLPKEV
jgi:two-component system response regulator